MTDPDLDFQCTRCTLCCRQVRLPLSVDEAVVWLRNGHPVEVLCEAIPWPGEPPATDQAAAYKRGRSFSARSGPLPVRVLVTLAAPLGEHCPHLQADDSCGNYERRPLVCRIYPAEIRPLIGLVPSMRACPEPAWGAGGPPFIRLGRYVDDELQAQIQTRRRELVTDQPALEELCAALGIQVAALANEGFVAHAPEPARLLRALTEAGGGAAPQAWRFASERAETVEALRSCGALCDDAAGLRATGLVYLGRSAGTAPA